MKFPKNGMGGMQQMLKQANQMQSRMKKIQDDLKQKTYSGKSAGKAINVLVSGDYLIKEITIEDDFFKEADKDSLQDLISIAVNQAISEAKKDSETQMNQVTGGAMPGVF